MEPSLQKAIIKANDALDLADSGDTEQAIQLLKEAIAEAPDMMVGARSNLGSLLGRSGKTEAAITELKAAITMKPDFAEAWNNLGTVLFHSTRTQAAEEAYARAVQIQPDYFEAHSNRCLMPLYRTGNTSGSAKAVEAWKRACAPLALEAGTAGNIRASKEGPFRIGFVSPDFRAHSVAYFLLPILERWSRHQEFALYLYSDVPNPDALTKKFQSLPLHFIPTHGLSHTALHTQIQTDRIDVLFELCGHFSYNRLPVFAMRAAPCQIAWLGYPVSTGTPNIDYRVTDEVVCPPGDETPSAEKLIRLKSGFHCYRPPEESPEIGPAPVSTGEPFTFGCFNNAFKISPEIAHAWGAILNLSPNARIVLKAKAFADPLVCQQILSWIHPDESVRRRVIFKASDASTYEHLNTYNTIDLALDTYPYNGTTTTCESLWMGVPCLTLRGSEEQSRVSASLLHQANLDQFVCPSMEHYIQLATALARAPESLSKYRPSLRAHLVKTPLMQTSQVADELLRAIVE